MNSNTELNVIAALDLDPIKVKLMHKESGEGWSLQQATAVEFEYRRFLCLMKLFPQEQVAPLFDVDIFWHYHILDTMKYAADCEQVFGYFLHHFPYLGLRGEEDEAAHNRVGVRMQELYEETFGEDYIRQGRGDADTANTAYSGLPAQNDSFYSAFRLSGTTKTAHSIGVAMNDGSYSMRPMSAVANTAHSIGVALNDGFYSNRPVSGAPKTAHSIGVPINDSFYSTRPVSGTVKTAHSIGVPLNDSGYSMRPASATTKTAHSIGLAQNDTFYSERPTLAHAA